MLSSDGCSWVIEVALGILNSVTNSSVKGIRVPVLLGKCTSGWDWSEISLVSYCGGVWVYGALPAAAVWQGSHQHYSVTAGVRPFKCPFEYCDRSFTTSHILRVHIRTHTGERPYTCPEPMCGRSFTSVTNYKNHIRIHTGKQGRG